jgi:hypothetical protein
MVFNIKRSLLVCFLILCNLFVFIFPTQAFAGTEILTVAGEGNYTSGTYVGGAGTFANLNSNDDDTSYLNVIGTANPLRHTYAFSNSVTTAVISSVTLYYRVKYMSAGDSTVRIYTRSGGLDYYIDYDIVGDTAYITLSHTFYTNPATGLVWDAAGINATEFGLEFSGTYRWTYVYIDVNYSTPTFPEVETLDSTNIGLTSSTFNGEVTNMAGGYITQRGFVWDIASRNDPGNIAPAASAYANNWTETNSWGNGAFSYSAAVLVADTTYYIRACAYNGTYWSYGSELSLKTIGTPIVTLLEASTAARVTARLNAMLGYDGNQPCDIQFGYDTITHAGNFAAYANKTSLIIDTYVSGENVYADIIGLVAGTTYFFNVAATNDFVTVYGVEDTFVTSNIALSPPTDCMAKPEMLALNISWVKDINATGTRIQYSYATYPTLITEGVKAYEGTDSSYRLTGLESGRTIFISFWSYSNGVLSATYAEVLVTTLASDVVIIPTLPSPGWIDNWLNPPISANLQKIPGHQLITQVSSDYSIPATSLWFVVGMIVTIAFASAIWAFDNNHSQQAALLALAVGLGGGVAAGIYSGWMLAFVIAMAVGAIVVAVRA